MGTKVFSEDRINYKEDYIKCTRASNVREVLLWIKNFAVAYDKREEIKAVETKPQPELSPNPGKNRRSNVND